MAAAKSILPKVSGEIKAVLPKSTKIASNAIESVSTTGSKLPRNLQLTPTSDLADFIPAVKGIGYTPGKDLFPNLVPTGNSQMGNSISAAGRSASRNFFLVECW